MSVSRSSASGSFLKVFGITWAALNVVVLAVFVVWTHDLPFPGVAALFVLLMMMWAQIPIWAVSLLTGTIGAVSAHIRARASAKRDRRLHHRPLPWPRVGADQPHADR